MVGAECVAQPRVQLALDQSVFLSENPFLLSDEDPGSSALEVAVRPQLDWQVGHATSLEIAGAARVRQYQRRYGDFVTGRVDANIRHRDSEYLSLHGTLGYVRELPTDALTGSLDAVFETRSVRETQSARFFADWSPDAVTTVNSGIGAIRTRYPGSSLLQTTKAYDFSIGLAKRLSARTTVGIQGQVAVSQGDELGSRTAKTLQLTATRRLDETWRADIRAGVEWAGMADPFDGGRGRERPRFTGSGTLCNESVRFMLCLAAALRSEVSALTGLRREWTLGADADWRLSEYGTLTLTGDYRKASGGPMPIDLFRLSAAYEHRLSQRFSLKGGVDYLRRSQVGDDRIGATIAHVTLTFRGFR